MDSAREQRQNAHALTDTHLLVEELKARDRTLERSMCPNREPNGDREQVARRHRRINPASSDTAGFFISLDERIDTAHAPIATGIVRVARQPACDSIARYARQKKPDKDAVALPGMVDPGLFRIGPEKVHVHPREIAMNRHQDS